MSANIPVYQGEKVNEEDTRLVQFFNDLEKKQLEFLDEAGKRIIELSTALLGVLFATLAFGDKFPPSYLAGNSLTKVLVIVTLLLYLFALAAGLVTVQPHKYHLWKSNLTEMHAELDKMIRNKTWPFRIGTILFGAGSLSLAALIISIIWNA